MITITKNTIGFTLGKFLKCYNFALPSNLYSLNYFWLKYETPFWSSGDDLFLIVENLRYYLESEEIRTAANGGIFLPDGNISNKQTPLLLGRRFAYQGDMNDIFDSGGSGYTMNKPALKMLVTEGFPNYFPHRKTFSEDTMVAKLLKKINVLPYDTKDDSGREIHAFPTRAPLFL